MSYEWQVQIEYRIDQLSTYIYVMRRVDNGHIQFMTKGGEQIVTKDITARKDEDIHFARLEDDMILRLLVQALDSRGIKAPDQSYIQGKLEAKEEHLQDLRKLIPKLTPVEQGTKK